MLSENKFLLVGGLVALAVILVMGKKVVTAAGNGLAAAGHALNPMNNDNIINQGATAVYQGATGSTGSIGTDAYDGVQWLKDAFKSDEEKSRGVSDIEQTSWY